MSEFLINFSKSEESLDKEAHELAAHNLAVVDDSSPDDSSDIGTTTIVDPSSGLQYQFRPEVTQGGKLKYFF